MSPRLEGPGGRIVVDPDDLRDVATRMRGAAVLWSGAGRRLALRELPAMPSGLGPLVTETICRANAVLQDLAVELIREAEVLSARATWAELGGDQAISWLIPGLHPYAPSPRAEPIGPSDELPPVTDAQIMQSTEWAVQLLDGMHDSMEKLDDEARRLGGAVEDVPGKSLLKFADEYADELPVKALGKFTLAAGAALDVYEHWDQGWVEAGSRAGMSAGGGALGTLACEALFAPTGVGILGCIFVGGGLGTLAGDQVGEEVFDE